MATCPLCGNTATREPLPGADGAPRAASRVTCEALCGGTFEITAEVADDPSLSTRDRHLLAGAVRHAALRGEILKLDVAAVREILGGIPRLSLAEQAAALLEYLELRRQGSREPVRLDPNKDYSVIYGTHPDELRKITKDLTEQRFIERAGPSADLYYALTLAGSQHLEERRRQKGAARHRGTPGVSREKGRTKRESSFGDWIRTDQRVGARSGQGDLFIAFHKDDKDRRRPYVLKQLRNPERAARFEREVHAALQLKHPGIVAVVAWDLSLDRPYLVMPYYQRGDLTQAHVIQMSPAHRLRLFAKICRAVGFAHTKGVVHRDIKPENVLVDDEGSPMVADFGLCFFKNEAAERETQTLEVVGSRFYKAPELEDGRADPASITPASDVYSLGKLLYWMFAGRSFEREKHHEPGFDLRGNEPRVAHALVYELLDRAIVEKPERRFFRDGNELAEAAEGQLERMTMEDHVLDLDVPQPCQYCRAGVYEICVDPRWWIPGLQPAADMMQRADWVCVTLGLARRPREACLVLRCSNCGNLQVFDLAAADGPRKNWKLTSLNK